MGQLTVHLSDGSFQTYEEDVYYDQIRIHRNAKDPNKRFHEINVKGYYSRIFYNGTLQKKFCDTTYGNGKILFSGSWDELDAFTADCVQNEGKYGFKII